jgi:hypothetical protein
MDDGKDGGFAWLEVTIGALVTLAIVALMHCS